jgi:hypothetical protein
MNKFIKTIVIFMISTLITSCKNDEVKIVYLPDIYNDSDGLDFKDSIFNFMESINLKHPDIVYSQILIETGRFSSDIFKENNNLFGMKRAYKRPFISKEVNRGHVKYPDEITLKGWQLSILDYALFQARFCNFDNEDDYLNYLANNYAEESKYVSLIKSLINKEAQ